MTMERREFLAVSGGALGSTFLPRRPLVPEGLVAGSPAIGDTSLAVRIVGLGGSGGNVIDRVTAARGWPGAVTISVNTDAIALSNNLAEVKVQIGKRLTRGLGSGARPEIGRRAAVENYGDIRNAISGADLVLMHCGLGGGTGTGAAPYVAAAAKDSGAMCVGVVSLPFLFEGRKRWRQAELGLSDLIGRVDSLIVVPQEASLAIVDRTIPFQTAIKKTDQQVVDLIECVKRTATGFPNASPAEDLKEIIGRGVVRFGTGSGRGPHAIENAAGEALGSPFWAGASLFDAAGVMVDFHLTRQSRMEDHDAATRLIAQELPAVCTDSWTTEFSKPDSGGVSVTVFARIEGPWARDFSMPRAPIAGPRFRRG